MYGNRSIHCSLVLSTVSTYEKLLCAICIMQFSFSVCHLQLAGCKRQDKTLNREDTFLRTFKIKYLLLMNYQHYEYLTYFRKGMNFS